MARDSKPRRGGGSRSKARASRPPTNRQFPRTARLNTLLQEIVAGYMERLDDDRIGFVTITGVEVDNDLNKAEVFFSTIQPLDTPEAEEQYLEALSEYRKPIKAEISRQARIRKTPEVVFSFDPGVRAGARIEEILSALGPTGTEADSEIEADSEAAADAAEVDDAERPGPGR